jgi:RHS repeat-associated protein
VLVDYIGSGTTSRRFLSTDERGSVVSLTDSSGALIGIDTYDEYGKPGAANQGRFQYTGQRWLSEIGAYDYKARVYLPHLGVFAQTDPIGQQDSPNLYAYVGDDPVNYVDPLGLRWVMACVGVPGGVPNCGLHWIADENPPGDTSRLDPNLRNENGRDRLSGGVVNPNPIFVICDAVCRARRALGFRRREIPGVWFASDCVIRGTCRAEPPAKPQTKAQPQPDKTQECLDRAVGSPHGIHPDSYTRDVSMIAQGQSRGMYGGIANMMAQSRLIGGVFLYEFAYAYEFCMNSK